MENNDIIKLMTEQLTNGFYSDSAIQEQSDNVNTGDGQVKIFQTDDDLVKQYISDIHEQVGSTHISFGDLKYSPQQKKVHWDGTIAGIVWTAVYTEKHSGFYFTADNKELSKEESLAFHKLNLYFQTVWFTAIRDAILKNELSV